MELPLWLWGLLGACGPEVYRWYLVREVPLPTWAKEVKYWVITVAMIAFGPVLVLMYETSGATLTPVVAFNIGASAPLLISAASRGVRTGDVK